MRCLQIDQKTNKSCVRISALASKKRPNKKSSVNHPLSGIKCPFLFDLFFEARAEIQKYSQDDSLKFLLQKWYHSLVKLFFFHQVQQRVLFGNASTSLNSNPIYHHVYMLHPFSFCIRTIQSSGFLRRLQKFDPIVLNVLTLLSNVKTLRVIGPNFCGLLRISKL